MMKNLVWIIGIVTLTVLISCADGGVEPVYELAIPKHFPKMPIPEDNPITQEKVDFGKLLFNDVRLSKNESVSCASCHDATKAFSDTVAFSTGLNGEFSLRNSTPIFNLGYHEEFFRDGGSITLEMQVIAPIENPLEMDMNVVDLCERLNKDQELVKTAQSIFGTEITPYVISRSLATYLRTLISGDSRYDQYLNGDEDAITDLEKEGFELFDGKAGCFRCHDGFDFTNYAYENIGLYEVYQDSGRMKITMNPEDYGAFKVPSLRNLSYTAPYMHDGSLKTLEEVIDLYDEGGKDNWNVSFKIDPIGLTDHEKKALKAFLLSLDDVNFVNAH